MPEEHRKRLIIVSAIIVAILIIAPTTYYEWTKQVPYRLTVIEGEQNYTWNGHFTNITIYYTAGMGNVTASTVIKDSGYADSYLNMTVNGDAQHLYIDNSSLVTVNLSMSGSFNSHLQPTSLSIMQNTTFNASNYHSVSALIIPNYHNRNINISYGNGTIGYEPTLYGNSFGQFSFVENLLNVSYRNNGTYHFYFYSEIEFEIAGIWPGAVPVLNFNAGINGLSSLAHTQIRILLNDTK